MYLVTIHVPIFVRGSDRLLSTDWKRSLFLLRDSFNGRFGRLRVVAPSIDATHEHDQPLETMHPDDELDLVPSFPFYTRARAFWREHVHTWRRDLAPHIAEAEVVHSGLDDVYRQMQYMGFLLGHRAGKPTVFVQDTDHVLQQAELARGASLRRKLKSRAYSDLYERAVRYGVARASLSLLKGQALIDRYGDYAKNARNFHDTSFFTGELVDELRLERRLERLVQGTGPLRFVYCGRLEARKGLRASIEAIAEARAQGARVTLDIIGDGAEHRALERQVEQLGQKDAIRFLGMRVYGPDLLSDLAEYDALLFTPAAEDTPRMIFDGYAAGLPLIGYAIAYVREREREDGAALSVERNARAMANTIVALDRERPRVAALAQKARVAAKYHAADAWYRRRAEWTIEAVERHRAHG